MSQTIIITGASAGIGKQTAIHYAKEEKANLVIAARNTDKLNELKGILEELGSQVLVVPTDVTNLEQIQNLFKNASQQFQVIDVVINNAGLGFTAPIFEQDPNKIQQMINVNIYGMIMVAKIASEYMIKQKSGHIVNISSVAGYLTVPEWSVYCASKFAIRGFSDSIRYELEPYNVYVTSIHPGPIKTEFFERGSIDINEDSMISVEECVSQMYESIKSKQKRKILPKNYAYMIWINTYFPFIGEFLIKQSLKNTLKNA